MLKHPLLVVVDVDGILKLVVHYSRFDLIVEAALKITCFTSSSLMKPLFATP